VKTVVTTLVLLALSSSTLLPSAKGQSLGALRGTVEDSTGAAVPGAEVKLRDKTTAKEFKTESDEEGDFDFDDLPAGQYVLIIETPGFENVQQPVAINPPAATRVRVRLRLAQVRAQVTVSAKADAAVSADEKVNTVQLDQHLLQNLPVKEGDPLDVPALFLNPAVAGAQGPQLIVDGVESGSLEVPMSSIKEIAVDKGPYTAEFARPGKGRINVTTRSGAHHRYRGQVSLLMRNSAFNARNAFATSNPPLQRAIAEAQLSGPVMRHFTFFIAGRYRVNNQSQVINARTASGHLTENVMLRERDTYLFGRLDYSLRRIHKLALTYKYKNKPKRNEILRDFDLPERAVNEFDRENELKIFETSTVSDNFLNEARFTFKSQPKGTDSVSNRPAIIVDGFFNSGGAQASRHDREKVLNFQDIASLINGRHTIRFGGNVRPRFLSAFDTSNFGGTFTFQTPAAYTAGQPFKYTVNQGDPRVSFTQNEFFAFIEDEFRARPNLSLSLGLRQEFQSHVPLPAFGNWAPRLSVAYAPHRGRTVIRAGAGVFYDRQPGFIERDALLHNGSRIQELVIQQPGFPDPFTPSGLVSFALPRVLRIEPNAHTPYLTQASVGVERQLGAGRNFLTVEFTTLRGVRLYRQRNINAPLPGTYNPCPPGSPSSCVPSSGLRPFGSVGDINEYETSGLSRGNSVAVTYQTTVGERLDVLAQYTLSKSMDDTSGVLSSSIGSQLDVPFGSFGLYPANSYDFSGEWGRSDFDRRHRFTLTAFYRLPFGLKTGAVVKLNSGLPYNITTGFDYNGDDVTSDRPAGVSRNTGNGPGYADLDIHLSRDFSLPSVGRHAKVEFGVDAFNLFNRVNFKNFIGVCGCRNLDEAPTPMTPDTFRHADAAQSARELQLSFKFRF